jgi:hypothetical protein
MMIKSVEKAASVYKGCRVLLEEQDTEEFHVLLNGFLFMCDNDPETKEFGDYFKKYYSTRVEKWAFCYRLRLGLNTNMYLEAMHKKLKYSYLKGHMNRRVDKLIASLLRFTRDIMFERLSRHIKSKPTKKMQAITSSHHRSKEITPAMIVEVSPGEWQVQSSALTRGPYLVTFKETVNCSCPLNCPACRACVHQVSCECHDFTIKLNFCKHIHACLMKTKDSRPVVKNKEEDDIISYESATIVNQMSTDVLTSAVNTNNKMKNLIEMAEALTLKIHPQNEEAAERAAEAASKAVERYVDSLQKLVESQESDSTAGAIPKLDHSQVVTPANKNIEPQRRFQSTKKRKLSLGKCERSFAKPGDIQRLVMKEIFVNKVTDKEVINILSAGDPDHTY